MSSGENDLEDDRYGSVEIKKQSVNYKNFRVKLPPGRGNHYEGDEVGGEADYDDVKESRRILIRSKKQDAYENRDSVHKNFYGRMNQVSIRRQLHEILAALLSSFKIKFLHELLCIQLSKNS